MTPKEINKIFEKYCANINIPSCGGYARDIDGSFMDLMEADDFQKAVTEIETLIRKEYEPLIELAGMIEKNLVFNQFYKYNLTFTSEFEYKLFTSLRNKIKENNYGTG